MPRLRIIVVDDEPLARKRLARLLRNCDCEVVDEPEDVPELLASLRDHPQVDALFLDIEMPGGTGMEAMAELPNSMPVIFVTAHAQHAARAFDANAVDYILKPVFEDRLKQALDKLRLHLAQRAPAGKPAAAPASGRFAARIGGGHLFLEFRRVSHFELDGQAVFAWAGGKRFQSPWGSLAEVQEAFQGQGLVRIQRHLLLRPEAAIGIRSLPKGRALVRVGEGLELEVSRSVTPRLREILGIRRGD
jgi:DNA-binding LytR/AlgR family response regulator